MAAGSASNGPYRSLIIALAVGLLAGWLFFSGGESPSPRKERPFLTWIAKAAKNLLWIALVAEEPPEELPPTKAEIGADGYVKVDHGRGW